MKLRLLLLSFSLLLLFALPVFAQAPEHPLAQMLAAVPGSAAALDGSFISYVDYRAVFSQRGGSFPTDLDEFNQMLSSEGGRKIWATNLWRIASGMLGWIQNFTQTYPEAQALFGFEWFDVDQSLQFGVVPAVGNVLRGEFDPDRVRAAFAKRDFESQQIAGVETLCWAEGCDQGLAIDLRSRNPANPFGGDFGRREPVALLPGILLHSPAIETLTGMIQAAAGAAPSLLANPDYAAIADLVGVDGATDADLIQIQIYRQESIADFSVPELPDGAPGPLPPYSVAALADLQDGDTQIALVALVYDDAAVAELAAHELAARVASFHAADEIADAQIEFDPPLVFTSAAGDRFVAISSLRNPTPPSDPGADSPLAPSASVFLRWYFSLQRREFYPIVSTD